MKIKQENCTGCKKCLKYCNQEAIYLQDNVAMIDRNRCVECGVCKRSNTCPRDCIQSEIKGVYESTKQLLSDPTVTNKVTGVPGRGTEEAKTNDITHRYSEKVFGICIDMGRPGVGTNLRDVETVAMALAKAGLKFAGPSETPLSAMMTDLATGKIKEDFLDLRVLSIIIEGTIERSQLKNILCAIKSVETKIDTVFSLGIIAKSDEFSENQIRSAAKRANITEPIRGKANMGLGFKTEEVCV
ncbi:MAG: 4Fe-4S ferredoxin [Nanoarchaeota archaeon]|nr:4Fe-4S ferredoxin [Nanoarchaeota archaeon]